MGDESRRTRPPQTRRLLDRPPRTLEALLITATATAASAAVQAGICTAFHAPITAVLFVVEEAATFFTTGHLELTFFACLVAYWVSWALAGFPTEYTKIEAPKGDYCSAYDGRDLLGFIGLA